jgi:4-hydroxybenzoate polyprenyltransferase/geranylgeranylglycerol-phosphate geranylgeranyltransferase
MTAKKLRVKLVAHLEMMRPYTLFHAGMLGFASALFISEGSAAPWRAALSFLVPTLGWLAGLYAGDYYDRYLDAIAKPRRPIPSGRVGAREAFCFMIGYISTGYVLALVLSPLALLVAVLTTIFGIAYSKTFKRRALLGNLDRGLLACFTVLFAGAATHSLQAGWSLFVLLGIFFFHDSSSNLIGAIRDLEGDREAGYRTVPVVYGLSRSVQTSGLLMLLGLSFSVPLFFHYRNREAALALFMGALLLITPTYYSLFANRKRLTRKQALGAHKVMVIERLILSAAVSVVYGSALVVLPLLAVTLAATQIAQLALRDRYELTTGSVRA